MRIKDKITYNVNEDIERTTSPLLNQFRSIVLLPLLLLVLTKVTRKSLLAPGSLDRVADRRKSRDRLVLARVAEELGSS